MKNLNDFMSPRPKKIFKEGVQPQAVSDYWHIFNRSNILNVVYWDKFFNHSRRPSKWENGFEHLSAIARLLHVTDLSAATVGDARGCNLVIRNFILTRDIFRAHVAIYQKFAQFEVHANFLRAFNRKHAIW